MRTAGRLHAPLLAAAVACGVTLAQPTAVRAEVASSPMSWVSHPSLPADSAASDDPLPIPESSAQEANDRADEILARPEYREPPKSLFERFMEWLNDLIGSVVEALVGGTYSAGLAWVVIVVLVGLSVLMVLRFRRSWSKVAKLAAPVEIELGDESVDWLAVAKRAEAQGDWKEAILYRYRALVAMLVDRGVLTVVPGRTVGEIRRDVAVDEPEVSRPFADASTLFESTWYGDAQVGSDDVAEFERWVGEVSDGVHRGARR